MSPRLPRVLRSGVLLLATLILAPWPAAHAQDDPSRAALEAQARRIKQQQAIMNREGAQRHIAGARSFAKAILKAKRRHQAPPRPGPHLKKAPADDAGLPAPSEAARRFAAFSTLAIPTNVQVNNTAGDDPTAGQAEQAIASLGSNILVAWNDGQGFVVGGDTQGYGWSVDGGASFTDGGVPAKPPAMASGEWTSDPVVTVNEKTGEFYYCGMFEPTVGVTSAVAIARGHFAGGTFVWDTVTVANQKPETSFFIDKQWMVADSLTGNLYLSYTLFTVSDDSIMVQVSTDHGDSWSAPVSIGDPNVAGLLQGSRPVVGPNGEAYVIWAEIGTVDQDYFRIRKSTDGGANWGPQVTVCGRYTNFGTGAPGFNRERSVDFPSIAVDRTAGPHRGRVYVTWHESLNWYDDFFDTGGAQNETENNNTSAAANPFTPGQILRGSLASTTDVDWFKWNATAGTTYMFWVDSIPRPLYSARIFCTDGATRLQFGGDLNAPAGGNAFMVFTAPATGVYFLRMFYVTGGNTGGYRVSTGVAAHGPEVGRDERDVVMTHSDDGTSWATPVRVNDDGALYDDWLPETIVGADGDPYVLWFDWRDATSNCNGSSHMYLARSNDGGASWLAAQRFSTAPSPWTVTASNIAPNQGDYSHVWADDRFVRPAWSDGRNPSADVFTTAIDTWHAATGCVADTALSPSQTLDLTVGVTNQNPLFANDYTYQVVSDRGWSLASGSLGTVAAGGGASAPVTITVPDTAAAGPVQACIVVTHANGTLVKSCCFTITVLAPAAVGDARLVFALAQNTPNPVRGRFTRIDFTLPREGAVRLEVFGLHGERVRTLVDGVRAAGPNSATWDGRDARGNPVPAGAYFYRLTGFGRNLTRRMVVLP